MNDPSSFFEEFKLYLPKYLSPASSKELFDNLKGFPENIHKRFYADNSLLDEDIIYQGDGIKDLPYADFPSRKISDVKSVVLTNTCDIDVNNERLNPSYICYSPLILLDKYEQLLLKNLPKKEKIIAEHINTIKKQKVTQIFYLPKGGFLEGDSIIIFNRVSSCLSESVQRDSVKQRKLFTLSNYGFYSFLFKLSLNFTRMGENVDRR